MLSLLLPAACAFVLSIHLIGLLLPFALYPTGLRVIVLLAVWGGFFLLLRLAWRRIIMPAGAEIRKRWLLHLLLAGAAAALTLSLTRSFTPLYPAEHVIRIRASGPLTFTQISQEERGWKETIIEPDEIVITGEWNRRGDVLQHMGSAEGEIYIRDQLFVSDPAFYLIGFERASQPATAEIIVNGVSRLAEIPAVEGIHTGYSFNAMAPPVDSYSRLFRLWLFLLPLIRWLSLLIFFFLASVFIRSRSAHWQTLIPHYLLLFTMTCLLYNSLNFQNEFVHFREHQPLILVAALIVFLLIPWGMTLLLKKHPRAEPWFIAALFVLAAGLRVYWVMMVPTAPVSDFGDIHRWALHLASGEPDLAISYHFNFTRLLSLLYRIYPSDRMAVGVNILLSLASMAGLLWIGRESGQRHAGILAAWLFAVLPSQIAMNGIVCTDILPTAALIFCAGALLRFWRCGKWTWLALGGFCLAVGFMIRGVVVMYAPLFLLPVIGLPPRRVKIIALRAAACAGGFLLGVLLIKAAVVPARVENMVLREYKIVTWTLLNGTNIAAEGKTNPGDWRLISQWTKEEAIREGLPMVFERIFSDPAAYYRFLKTKYYHFIASDAYGADLAFLGEDMNYQTFQTHWSVPTQAVRAAFAWLSQYAFWCLLGAGLALIFLFRKEMQPLVWACLGVLVLSLVGFAFFEVQSRYHIPLMPFLVILAGVGLAQPRQP